MTDEPFETSEDARRDRREHGGASSLRPDDDELARRTEQERVEAGIDDYDPDDVPPATDEPVPTDLTESEEYQEAEAEFRREESEGEVYPLTEKHPFPPSHYDRS
ncbi:hypothetical protein AB0I34_17385 [Kribbella sp. NPDC050281]|uniref:hypothetical protein n=1 Tax=Kribbella TaxID=182639 RepID=UPI00192DBD7C|nr:hypothetical protein [Kribbella pittospori]